MKSKMMLGYCAVFLSALSCFAAKPICQDEIQRILTAGTSDEKIRTLLGLIDHRESLNNADTRNLVLGALISNDELVRIASSTLIEDVPAPFLNELEERLKSPDDEKYILAAMAIKTLGKSAHQTLPLLKRGLDSNDYNMQLSTLWALESIGEGSEVYLELLKVIIEREYPPGPEFNLQCGALRVLGALGPLARPEIETVMKAARAGQVSVRTFALMALGNIACESDTAALEIFEKNLDSQLHVDRERALIGLMAWGKPAKPLLPKIRDLMLDSDKNVLPFAAYAYYRISGETELPLKVLGAILSNPTYETDTIDMLAKMGPEAKSLLPKVVEKLASEDAGLREVAVLALPTLGQNDEQVVTRLQNIADADEDPLIRHFAKRAIKSLTQGEGKK